MGTAQHQWQAAYLGAGSVCVVGGNLRLRLFAGCPECAGPLDFVKTGTASGSLIGAGIVSFMEAFRIMVMLPADYLRLKFIEPLKEKQRKEAEARAKAIADREARIEARGEARGRAQGVAEGEARMRDRFVFWLARKEEAERLGLAFNEPMPGPDSGPNGHSPQA